jgi:dTDP-glucose 4,6-dehydratase
MPDTPPRERAGGGNPLAADLDMVLEQTRDFWDEVRGRRLFITGGTGFFGSWLLETFSWACDRLALGAEAVVLTRRPEAFAQKASHLAGHPAVKLHRGDVRDFTFPEGPFSHVIHAATEASTNQSDRASLEVLDTVVQGTRRVLDFAVRCRVRKLLFTSSGAVYGRQPPEMTHVAEDYAGAPDTMDPRSAYGEGKRVGELLCAIYAREQGIEVKIARCFAFVGPYMPMHGCFAIGNFIRDALSGGPIEVKGDGTPCRSYLYAADLAAWLWTILFRGKSCRPYNVGGEKSLCIREAAMAVAAGVNPPCRVQVQSAAAVGKSAHCYVPSVGRANDELGVRPTVDLPSGVARTLEWLRVRNGRSADV